MAEREHWEYRCMFIDAQIENSGANEYIKARWPNWKIPQHAPQTMDPVLNSLGNDGWELIQMEPVIAFPDGQVQLSGGELGNKTSVYFAVFKRKKPG